MSLETILGWGSLLLILLVRSYIKENFGYRKKVKRKSEITDEDLLTYSLLTGNKEMEKAMLWKIWSK